jgi:hypothetical protein
MLLAEPGFVKEKRNRPEQQKKHQELVLKLV